MSQPEARISQAIMDALRVRGYFCFKVHGSEKMMAGLPDIICCINGMFLGLETKTPDKRKNTSPRQKFVHERIKGSRGFVHVVCSVPEALAVVEGMVAQHRVAKRKKLNPDA
ncbi:hypothetical protein ACWIG4_30320 [Streptomyces sp. NPDC002248]